MPHKCSLQNPEKCLIIKTDNFFKANYRDWKWWYKLGFSILLLGALILDLTITIVFIEDITFINSDGSEVKKWLIGQNDGTGNYVENWDYNSAVVMFFSYFTNQSNFLVLAWLIYAWLKPQKEGKAKFLSFNSSILIATYISITSFIWFTLLMPTSLAFEKIYHPIKWVSRVFLHAVIPLAFVIYVTLFMNRYKVVKVNKWAKHCWKPIIYPLIYGIIMVIRGEIRTQAGFNGPSSYPYFFMNVHNIVYSVPGYAWLIISIIAISGLAIGFSYLYVWAINFNRDKIKKNKRKNSKEKATLKTFSQKKSPKLQSSLQPKILQDASEPKIKCRCKKKIVKNNETHNDGVDDFEIHLHNLDDNDDKTNE